MADLQNLKIERNKRTNGYCVEFVCKGKKYYASSAVVRGGIDTPDGEYWGEIGETMIFPIPEGKPRPDFGNEVYMERYMVSDVTAKRLQYDIEQFCLFEEW